ncbi:MAG TPA: methyltransferase domain-containing protein [Alphaproteobacteria bacterium]|nr:methyltransferase domain-containing protein [Alphaproteobacteria bacterium]
MATEAARRKAKVDPEFAYFRDRYAENMERMFAAVSDLYARYWNDFFHFALFEDGADDWEAAFGATHRKYAEALKVAEAANVLDLACGRGGFAHFLSRSTSGNVLGIDISRSQLSQCSRFQGPNLRFRHHDIMKADELQGRFDAVALLDADCYLPDKRLAIAKIAKVMVPDGRFLLVSWCKRDGLGRAQEELVLRPFMRYWGVPGLETPRRYRSHLERAGFRILAEEDLNDRARPNWEFGYEQAIKGVREFSRQDAARLAWTGMALGADGIRLIKDQFPAALYIKAGFDAGFLRYTYFLAERR